MGAKPSSAVQQSAYLEALDKYIDYDEDGNLRKCLLDQSMLIKCINVGKEIPVMKLEAE
jgi:hypothetical protein